MRLTTCVRDRATEMDITMIGLQNAGKTSLLRVLAVSDFPHSLCLPRRTVQGSSVYRGLCCRVRMALRL